MNAVMHELFAGGVSKTKDTRDKCPVSVNEVLTDLGHGSSY